MIAQLTIRIEVVNRDVSPFKHRVHYTMGRPGQDNGSSIHVYSNQFKARDRLQVKSANGQLTLDHNFGDDVTAKRFVDVCREEYMKNA